MRLRRSVVFVTLVLLTTSPFAGAQQPEKRQVGQMILDGIPAWDDAVPQRLHHYLQVRGAYLRGVSDDGQAITIATRFCDTAQLHLIEQPLGARRQITFFDEPVAGGRFIPDTGGKQILLGKDRGGNEKRQFHRLDLNAGSYTLLTDGSSRNDAAIVSKSGRMLAFTSTARNQRDFDIYLRDLTTDAEPKLLWEVQGWYRFGEFSPDESKLLVANYISAREAHWFVYDIASGQHAPITPESPPTYNGNATWSADGKAVYITSDREGEFRKLYRLDLQYGHWQCLTADIDWDVTDVAVEPTGKGLAFVVNEDGVSRLYFCDPWGKAGRAVEGLPTGWISGLTFAAGGGTLGLTVDTATAPSDAYTVSYADGQVTRWTVSEVGGLNPDNFVAPQVIRYPSFDQVDGQPRLIPAFYYKGRGDGPRPVVIYTHGGPEGQYIPRFRSSIQYWTTELGLSVIAPNVRGSTGYGRAFHQLDNGKLREDAIKDIGGLLDWIKTQPDLDASRVGIYGGSYGGYMVLGSLVMYPERFKAGVTYVGIADFITFLKNTSEYRRDLRREEYGDERDPEMRAYLEKISPLKNAEKITAALLVLHGKNDPRVPASESEQLVAKLRGMDRATWYALALNEGHGFRKKTNRDLAAVLQAAFWQEHLAK